MNNFFQVLQMFNNPQRFLQNMAGNQQIMQNPMIRNAMTMYQNGDSNGLKQMAENICREKGINSEEALKQVKSYFGM